MAWFLPLAGRVSASRAPGRPAVLIAASQPELREVLRYVLRDAAYEPAFAADGIEVVTAVTKAAPDLLLLDMDLARLDGLVALELVRAVARDLPVVLVSCVTGPTLGLAAERFGVSAVLRKPFRNAELLEALARGLARRNGGSADGGERADA